MRNNQAWLKRGARLGMTLLMVASMSACSDCKSDKTAELNIKMEALYNEAFSALAAGDLHECRAYGDGVTAYTSLVNEIKTRARIEGWAACSP